MTQCVFDVSEGRLASLRRRVGVAARSPLLDPGRGRRSGSATARWVGFRGLRQLRASTVSPSPVRPHIAISHDVQGRSRARPPAATDTVTAVPGGVGRGLGCLAPAPEPRLRRPPSERAPTRRSSPRPARRPASLLPLLQLGPAAGGPPASTRRRCGRPHRGGRSDRRRPLVRAPAILTYRSGGSVLKGGATSYATDRQFCGSRNPLAANLVLERPAPCSTPRGGGLIEGVRLVRTLADRRPGPRPARRRRGEFLVVGTTRPRPDDGRARRRSSPAAAAPRTLPVVVVCAASIARRGAASRCMRKPRWATAAGLLLLGLWLWSLMTWPGWRARSLPLHTVRRSSERTCQLRLWCCFF